MRVLIIAEHDNCQLRAATLNTITAASRLGNDISVLVAGHNAGQVADAAATITGVSKVLSCNAEHYAHSLAEELAPLVARIGSEYDYILAPATTFGKNVIPRIAALLDVAAISDIVDIINADTFIRPIYAGNALATVQSSDRIKLITVRGTAFAAAQPSGDTAQIDSISPAAHSGLAQFIDNELTVTTRPELTSARVVVSGGRGMGSAENFSLIEALADRLNAAIGASRAAVDAGYVPNDFQVGQTGKIVAPELYIAVGISGAIQHLAGMKESKVIVAINKDEEAPIFEVADYGLVADLFTVLPELTAALAQE